MQIYKTGLYQRGNNQFSSFTGFSNCSDLIYESSFYKVFEMITPINWSDAQSSCAIWGGDLTSITTERENNYLNIIIPDTVSNCWIGLNDRDVEGTYTWIDGTELGYTNWTSIMSDYSNSVCVQINNTGEGYWNSVNCEVTSNTFVCKRQSSISFQGMFDQSQCNLWCVEHVRKMYHIQALSMYMYVYLYEGNIQYWIRCNVDSCFSKVFLRSIWTTCQWRIGL